MDYRADRHRTHAPINTEDLVDHFENRVVGMDGKAMIVCMSRRICVALYGKIFE